MEKIMELKQGDVPSGVFLAKVSIDELKEQDVNPRTMSKEMFSQLKDNIDNKGGMLESLPYVAGTERGIEIVSGHHRVRASKAAGFNEIFVLYDDNGLTRDEIISKQLSHNSISGFDDQQLVAELYSQIQDVDQKVAAFIDEDEVKKMIPTDVSVEDLDVGIEFHNVNLLFLPHQIEKFDEVLKLIDKQDDAVAVAELQNWKKFKEAVNKTRGIEDIKSVGMAIAKICDIVLEHYKKESDEEGGEDSEMQDM